jgi:hypothetical protein
MKADACVMLFTVTVDWVKKFFPVMISVNPALPVVTPEGEMAVICGAGLGAGLIVKVNGGSLVPPPGVGVTTVTSAWPAF